MFWPLSRTTPRSGTASPLTTRSAVDLPAPLVPSSATRLALLHLEVDAEQHLHRAVREVDVGELQDRDVGPAHDALLVLVLLLEQLLHHQRQVVADEAGTVHEQERRR